MEKLSEEKARTILKKEGVELKPEEVKIVLEFLRKLSAIIVSNYLHTSNNSDV